MLQNKYLPNADFSNSEFIEIDAPFDKVFPVVEELNFKESRVIYWLFKLRGIPVPESLTLKGLEKINFVKLETIPDKELIIGLIGQFWTPTGRLKSFKSEDFISFENLEFAKAIWSFELSEGNNLKTRLNTETRILCPTDASKAKFKIYWTIIQPFSSWIRREILKALRKQVEIN
ncbi:hypothetical protein SYJ56_25465 [Algoriphagus sp. D3-2-R+10]|uniref:hypothetical protein n=1 Tax=Algoriphagus aurantiacus TaxID=3103948 RepID=UPI002B3CB90E|nr:hypothetical protein [Algoriphagus sp. D3-2-R+10]MEB2778682.1 hypothetical protein [Algoriphagus sp. D3-2-R+10]